jgi:hypothetical protein
MDRPARGPATGQAVIDRPCGIVTGMNPRHLLFLLCAVVLSAQEAVPRRPELLLLLPEPRVLGTELSIRPEGARDTVFSPAREIAETPGIQTYTKEEFQKLGVSVDTFAERARAAADRLLATIQPDLVKDAEGRVRYAVYRSDLPLMASLVTAPSLPITFEKLFGAEIWVALPDRHSLFVFPANPDALQEFSTDLAERYRADAHAASPEIFTLKKGEAPKVLGSFGGS